MIELPPEVQKILDLANTPTYFASRKYAWKLLSSVLERHGLRWEYFVIS